MGDVVRKILKKDLSDKQKSLFDLLKSSGGGVASKMVGGYDNLIHLLYGGDFKKYVEENNIELIKFSSDELNMYLHPSLAELLGDEDNRWGGEKFLGKFKFGSSNRYWYSFNAYLYPIKQDGEIIKYRVVGLSGDSGFGYGFISKRNTLGKRHRRQIFKQIIDKFELSEYLN